MIELPLLTESDAGLPILRKNMIRFKVSEQVAKKAFSESRRLTLQMVADETGISRVTLSKLRNKADYSTGTDVVNTLCAYFECQVQDLLVYVAD